MTQVPDSHRDLLEVPVATLATIGPDGRPQLSSLVPRRRRHRGALAQHQPAEDQEPEWCVPVLPVHASISLSPSATSSSEETPK